MGFLIVFLGGGLGAALRHGVNISVARLIGTAFPYATMIENVSGSLAMGILAASFAFKGDASQHWRLFMTTGILGGYTTFALVFARCGAAIRARRNGNGRALCDRVGLAVDWRIVCRARTGAEFLVTEIQRSIGAMPSLSMSSRSRSGPGLGVVSSFGP